MRHEEFAPQAKPWYCGWISENTDCPESRLYVWVFLDTRLTEIFRYLEHKMVPIKGTFCTHEYDCCGHEYADRIDVAKDGIHTIVTQRWQVNC